MNNTAASSPSIASRFRRIGLPVLIVGLAVGSVTALWSLPGMARDGRGFNSVLIVGAAGALLTIWMLTLSGLRWPIRIGLLAIETVTLAILLPNIAFDGDMTPHLRPLFERTKKRVEEARAEQGTAASPVSLTFGATDWPEYRGVKRDGIVVGPKLARDWKKKPPRLLWKQPCGEGWSSFSVAGNLLVTIEQRGDNEAIVGYDTADGAERWKYEYPARFHHPLGGVGPRATPTIAGERIFSLGGEGHLVCLDAKNGSHRWTVNILEGTSNLKWGMSGSPLVVDGKVIVNPGKQNESDKDEAVRAYDAETGKLVWAAPGKKSAYVSPMLATLEGEKQVIIFDGEQCAGYELAHGALRWSHRWDRTLENINVAQSIIYESTGRVFISSGYTIGCAMLQVSRGEAGWSVSEIWRMQNKPLRCKLSSAVEHQGYIYGLDEGMLACISAADGKLQWKGERYGHGQLLRWNDLLVVLTEKGRLVLVEANPKEPVELGRIQAIEGDPTWNVPAMVDGRIFVRNYREMACFDLRE